MNASPWRRRGVALLAAGLFCIDVLGWPLPGSALYGLLVLAVAFEGDGRQVKEAAAGCAVLALAGFALVHLTSDPREPVRNLLSSLGVLAASTLLALAMADRTAARSAEAGDDGPRSTEAAFALAPVALWEEDYSGIVEELHRSGCRTSGELASAVERDPGVIFRALSYIRSIDMNEAVLDLLGARDRAQVLDSHLELFGADAMPALAALLGTALDAGEHYRGHMTLRTFRGGSVATVVSARFLPQAGRLHALVAVMPVAEG